MNEDALRALVRDTIARLQEAPQLARPPQLPHLGPHPSSYQYTLPPSDGPCFIEPGVQCNHCGYCETHGH